MKKLHRRDFLKRSALFGAGLAGMPATPAAARKEPFLSSDRMAVLVDTTVCIGCRNCEWACKEAHGIPSPPLTSYEDPSVFEAMRRPDEISLTTVNRFPAPDPDADGPATFVKVQCMHCAHPACASACIVGALKKRDDGVVIWDDGKCIGCRYCMVACPFQIPAFEYGKALHPRITKCDFCAARRAQGHLPACVEICPAEALTFGPRDELVAIARARVRQYPERYVNHIYGEYEVGGTDWLYLAGSEFAKLKFPALGHHPAPGVSESIQHGIFAYFIPPVLLYALLGTVMWMSKNHPAPSEES